MPYTFGGTTGDDASGTVVSNYGADNSVQLLIGMFYPTTLTATRAYMSFGATFRVTVDSTNTDEIRIFTNATTPGQWLTSDANITTNRWWLIAALISLENTTVPGAVRIYVGNDTTAPYECTVTNPTVRVGNYTGNAIFTIGNAAAGGTVAFQGDIAWACAMNDIHNVVLGPGTFFPTATSGVITQAEADHIYQRWIMPFYLGQPDVGLITPNLANNWSAVYWPGITAAGYILENQVNGVSATFALGGPPVFTRNTPFSTPPPDWLVINPYVRS